MNVTAERLSKKAREEYAKLQAKLADIVAADKVREPELTDDEKAEIAQAEARLEKSRPISQMLRGQITTKEERLKYLERNSQIIITEGGDVDELAAELALLKPALELLEEAYNSTNHDINVCELAIKRIKENARTREIHQEAQNDR